MIIKVHDLFKTLGPNLQCSLVDDMRAHEIYCFVGDLKIGRVMRRSKTWGLDVEIFKEHEAWVIGLLTPINQQISMTISTKN